MNPRTQVSVARCPRPFLLALACTTLLTTISILAVCTGAFAGEGLKQSSVSGATMNSAEIRTMPVQGTTLIIIDGAARPDGAALQALGAAGVTNIFSLESASSRVAQVPDVPWRTLVLLTVCFLGWQSRSLWVELRKAEGEKLTKDMQLGLEAVIAVNKTIELSNKAAALTIKAKELRARMPEEYVKAIFELVSNLNKRTAARGDEPGPESPGADTVQQPTGK